MPHDDHILFIFVGKLWNQALGIEPLQRQSHSGIMIRVTSEITALQGTNIKGAFIVDSVSPKAEPPPPFSPEMRVVLERIDGELACHEEHSNNPGNGGEIFVKRQNLFASEVIDATHTFWPSQHVTEGAGRVFHIDGMNSRSPASRDNDRPALLHSVYK